MTARAVAAAADLVELAVPLLAPGGDPGRLEARRPGRGARRAAGGRWTRSAAAGSRSRRSGVPALAGHRAGRGRPTAGASPAAYPRDPAARRTATVVSGAAATLTARCGSRVLSDIHSNLVALDAVLADIGTVDAVWHLGDVVGYGPEPDAVVERLAAIGAVGVRGNHDAAAAGGPEIDWLQPRGAARRWSGRATRIAPATRDWLAALPERLIDRRRHPGPRQPARPDLGVRHVRRRSPGPSLDVLDDAARAPRPHARPDRLRAGRTAASRRSPRGRTSRLALDGRPSLLNPGSVGQPRDGDPRASYLVLDTDARTRDAGTASPTTSRPSGRDARRSSLPVRLAERLRHGL